jgi:uncharacterized protein (DUF697 family)
MSNRTRILALYEKLERLVARLPGPLQKPILAELEPVKKLFLLQRVPRIVLLGQRGAGRAHLVNAFFNAEVLRPNEDQDDARGWQEIKRIGRGKIRLLDARRPETLASLKSALADEAPDIFLFLRSPIEIDDEFADDIDRCVEILEFAEQRHATRPALVALLVKSEHDADVTAAREQLHAALLTKQQIDERLVTTLTVSSFMRFRIDGMIDAKRDERENIDRLAQIIAEELPDESRLEMARLCGVRPVQMQIAQTLIKSVTAICTAIGTQPIPIADFPVLTTLQVMLVAGISYISGRELSTKLAGEFIAALGANISAGLVLREGARALLKLFPGWGNAISGAIAGAGTYAIGRAATGYFIEGLSIKDARQIFRRIKSKRRELPPPR